MKINPRSRSKHYAVGIPAVAISIVGYYNPAVGAILAAHPEVITGILGALFLLLKERQLFRAKK